MQRYNQRLVEEMKNKQTQERVRLPKIQRSEAKTRMAMFKKSLRITAVAAITPEQEREKIKQVRKCWIHMGRFFLLLLFCFIILNLKIFQCHVELLQECVAL